MIDYDEFLREIVGEMNPRRTAIVKRAFDVMDANGNGVIELSDIKGRYSARMHPEVLQGHKTEDEVLYEFLDTFEAHYQVRHPESKASHLREINIDEWNEYYNNISCSIDNDDYFDLMITNAYNLNDVPKPKQAWGGQM